MLYAKVENGSVVQYPYLFHNLRKDNPNISFPRTSMEQEYIRSDYGVVEVKEKYPEDIELDVPISSTHTVLEVTPVLVNGNWTQDWELIPKTLNELENVAVERRRSDYGPVENQIEFITENGLEAWQAKVAEIKARHPYTRDPGINPAI